MISFFNTTKIGNVYIFCIPLGIITKITDHILHPIPHLCIGSLYILEERGGEGERGKGRVLGGSRKFLYRSFVCVFALLMGTLMYKLIGIFNVHTNRARKKRERDERGRGGREGEWDKLQIPIAPLMIDRSWPNFV